MRISLVQDLLLLRSHAHAHAHANVHVYRGLLSRGRHMARRFHIVPTCIVSCSVACQAVSHMTVRRRRIRLRAASSAAVWVACSL